VEPPNPSLQVLVSTLGEEDARKLVRMFLADFPSMLEKLGKSERTESQRVAHSLKSSAHHMGALALSRRLAKLEERLGQPEASVTHDDLAGLALDFDRAVGPLRLYARSSGG
jgi:HPt (histidine-containing phosphotransfer) domain-containing protein